MSEDKSKKQEKKPCEGHNPEKDRSVFDKVEDIFSEMYRKIT